MAGLEVVVRPVIFPNIRPTPRQSLPPQDDPTKGFAVIRGQPASAVDLTSSRSVSVSYSFPTETGRTVDEARVYQKDDSGEINRDNYIDLQVPHTIRMKGGRMVGYQEIWTFKPLEEGENVEIIKRNVYVPGPGSQ